VCVCVTVACVGPVGAGQVLRDGAQREGAAHADVPGLERPRQLRHAHEEEEAQAIATAAAAGPVPGA